jgi:sialate O-acetylesterase
MHVSKVAAAFLLLTLGFASAPVRSADLTLAPVFSDHMVIQREKPIHVWGRAASKANVLVALGKTTRKATTGDDGKWSVEFDALSAGGPYELSISSGKEAVTVQDILLGDVWLCSGQSNMQFGLSEAIGHEAALEKVAADPSVRLLMIPKAPATQPSDSFTANWTKQDTKATSRFTAVGIFFAVALREHDPSLRDVPIGLIDSSFGGTRVEGWIPSDQLTTFRPEDLRESMFGIKPTQLYNAMIAPLAGTGLKGVLWYQGESNTAQAALYPQLLGTMIRQWREDFRDPALPFYLVQLANFPDPWEGYSFAWLRDAQAKAAASIDHVHLAVAIDTPDGYDLHPKHKSQLGDRLARLAAKHTYGKDVVAEGPAFRSATPEGSAMRVEFDVGGSPLAVSAGMIGGFDLAGEDGIFYAARTERIDDHTMRVFDDHVPAPRFVRYAFRADPAATIFNRDGIPAAPFRTDSAPQAPMCEVQQTRPARRVVTPTYSARIEADGRLASLQVDGQELFSPDDGGGFAPLSGWGWRKFYNATDVGPQSVRFFDASTSVTYTFAESEIRIKIANDSNDALPARFLLNPLATTADKPDAGKTYSFSRNQNALTILGADSVEKLFDVVYQVKMEVKPHESREVTVQLSKPAAK